MAANEPRLFIALYTDENIDGRLAEQLRARGYDVPQAATAEASETATE